MDRTNTELQPFEKVFPQSPSGARGWSDTSDVLSTQGSGSYYEEYVPSAGYESRNIEIYQIFLLIVICTELANLCAYKWTPCLCPLLNY